MEIEEKIKNTIEWLKDHEKEFGEYDNNIYSTMLALSTYYKLMSLDCCKGIFTEIDNFVIEQCDFDVNFLGDLMQLLMNWSYIKPIMKERLQYSDLQSVIREKFFDNDNRMDTIDKLSCFTFLNMDNFNVQTMLDGAWLELSNIHCWKYLLVKKPMYCRKIHNSFHYSSPYFLVYLLSKLQFIKSILMISMETLLENIIIDGYNHFEQLNFLDQGLLLCATPKKYYELANKVIPFYIEQQERQGFTNIPFYYDNLKFAKFIGSKTYTAAVYLEALTTAGKYTWSDFLKHEKPKKENNCIDLNLKKKSGKISYVGKCRMIMKEHCMEPYLNEGDEIEISYDFQDSLIGDILVFRHFDGRILAHRIIDIIIEDEKKAIITAADNGGLWGYPVFKKDIIGKVVAIFKHEQ